MTRYEDTHESTKLIHNIYMKQKRPVPQKWSQKRSVCLHVSGINVLRLHLGTFKLKMEYELFKLGLRGTPDIPESTWSMSKTKPIRLPARNMWAEMESLGLCS